jgi:hypothetical protein
VQEEALIAKEDLEVAEERLAAIERNELGLGFDDEGIGEHLRPLHNTKSSAPCTSILM